MRVAIFCNYRKIKLLLLMGLVMLVVSTHVEAQHDSISLIHKYNLEELINLKIVTADKHEKKIEDISANVQILTKQDIENLGYKNLNEILQNVSSFYYIEDHYWLGSRNYGVRGYFKNGPFSNVAILINGVNQMSDKYSDYPDVKITLPIEAIQRIEIIKGPNAVMYGNGAFFGVINIITTQQQSQEVQSQVNISGNTQGGKRVSLQLADRLDELNYKLILGHSSDPGPAIPYQNLTSNSNIITSVGLQEDATTKGHLSYSDVYSGIQIEYNDLRFDFSYNESNKGVFDGTPSYSGNNLNTLASNIQLEYRKSLSESVEFSLLGAYFLHSHLLDYSLYHDYYYELDYQKTNSYFMETHIKWEPRNNITILAGINNRTISDLIQISDFPYYGLSLGDGKIGLPDGENISTHSGYLDFSLQLSDKLKMTGGFRIEYLPSYNMYYTRGIVSADTSDQRSLDDQNIIEGTYTPSDNGFSFVPKISLIYEPVEKQFLKLMYGEAKKYPSFTENYRQLPQRRPQLNASKIQTLELNYYSYAIEKLVMSHSVFVNRLDNIIELTNSYDTESGEWDIYSANSGKMHTMGLESEFKYLPNESIHLSTGISYQKTSDLREDYHDVPVAYSPNLLANINLQYKLQELFTLGLSIRYIGKMYTYYTLDPLTEIGTRLAPQSDPYMIADLTIRKNDMGKYNIYAECNMTNLSNTDYRFPTTKSNEWIDKGVPGKKFCMCFSTGLKF